MELTKKQEEVREIPMNSEAQIHAKPRKQPYPNGYQEWDILVNGEETDWEVSQLFEEAFTISNEDMEISVKFHTMKECFQLIAAYATALK